MKKYMNKALACLMAALMMITGCIHPVLAEAAETYDTETGLPLLSMIEKQLTVDEIIRISDATFSTDEPVTLVDPAWTRDKDDVVQIKVFSSTAITGGNLNNHDAGRYTVYYVVTPVSGNPAYEISRVITITEPVLPEVVEESDSSDEAQDDDTEDDPSNEDLFEETVDGDMDEPVTEIPDEDLVDEFEEPAAEEEIADSEDVAETDNDTPDEESPDLIEDEAEEIPSDELTDTESSDSEELPDEEIPSEDAEEPTEEIPMDDPDTEDVGDPDETVNDDDSEIPDLNEEELAELEAFMNATGVTMLDESEETNVTAPDEESDPDDTIDEDNIVLEGPAVVDRGSKITYPSDLGSYSTRGYKVDGKTAYCLESAKSSPANGSYAQEILDSNENLTKALYYGYGGPGDVTAEFFPSYSGNVRYILTHIAASYFYTGSYSSATKGCSSSGLSRYRVREWISYLEEMENPPSPAISISDRTLTVDRIENGVQTTNTVTLQADHRNSITINVPESVTYHNVDTAETQTGGNVTVYGGTSFFFTAPASTTGVWETGAMNGLIARVWKVIVVATGTKTQHLGSYAAETYGGSVHFSVEWNDEAQLRLIKVDSANTNNRLGGAQFGVYSDSECNNQIAQMTTDANGEASCSFTRVYPVLYVKELTAPQGYRINRTIYSVQVTDDPVITMMVKNDIQSAGLKITKKGEMLADAIANENGVQFVYQMNRLSGATFRVTANSAIYNTDGSLIFQKGDIVADNLITNAEGEAFLSDLPLGSYVVEETSAPAGYVLNTEKHTVTLEYAGQEADVAFDETTFINQRQRIELAIQKIDAATNHPLADAIFGLFAENSITNARGEWIVTAGTLIETAVSDNNGQVHFNADLPVGYNYSISELSAPAGYVVSDAAYSFACTAGNSETIMISHTFKDEHIQYTVNLKKVDAETGTPQGDASLSGAVYGLYARENISYPDGNTGLLFEKDSLVTTMTTDSNGCAAVDHLYTGKYYIKEITPSVGYLLDTNTYNVDCTGTDQSNVVVECTVQETVMKQPFQIIKAVQNGQTDAQLLEGAGFSAWLVSDLDFNRDGSYDFTSTDPVVLGKDGMYEIYTDKTGHAESIPLPYGIYIVREVLTPHNYAPVDDFYVVISENAPTTPQVWRVLLDKEFAAKLQIVKVDAETGRTILIAGAEFTIYNEDSHEYVSQITTYPQTTTHNSFKTDTSGTLILPQTLQPGHYTITEVSAPNGYLINPVSVSVTVSDDTPYRIDGVSGDPIIEVMLTDRSVKGRIQVLKEGEMLSGYENGNFVFENRRLSGAIFDVVAAEDIYSADRQADENGNRFIEYVAGTVVATLTTDANGSAVTDDLPLGKYLIREKQSPSGFVLNSEDYIVTLSYVDQNTEVVVEATTCENLRQKVQISVEKLSMDGTKKLPGAVFGLYTAHDIVVDGTMILTAGACLTTATTDETGTLIFDMDLPIGSYLINEITAPAGYIKSDEVFEINAAYQGQDVLVSYAAQTVKNEPTKVAISKADATTGVELDGAQLTLMDTNGTVIETWTSVAGEPHMIEGLTVGATYILKEKIAPYGYLIANSVKFVVGDTADVQKVIMKDDVPTGKIIITKTGDFLSSVSPLDSVGGWASNAFGYITGSMQDVTFAVYAYDDIHHADGASPDYYKAGTLIGKITTDSSGIAVMDQLPLGRYYVVEVATQDGFVLDNEQRMIDLTYRDSETPVVTYSEAWQNERRRLSVKVLKTADDGDIVLPGAVFGLYAGEDITANGTVIMREGTLIEQRATDSQGVILFDADLPVSFDYYIKEITPPAGYACEEQEDHFHVDPGNDSEYVIFERSFVNKPTVVSVSKTSLTTGEELEGAHLQITDSNGSVIENWISGTEPHIITGLIVSEAYTLTETLPANGYTTAESITFTISNTSEVQPIEMKDDITKVEFSKTDIAGKELEGAKLILKHIDGTVIESWTSTKEPHMIEMLPIGKYILHEESAPAGYLVAEDVEFEVLDTNVIQYVVMKDATEPSGTPDTPKTGDDMKPVVWGGIAGLSLFALVMLLRRNRRKK